MMLAALLGACTGGREDRGPGPSGGFDAGPGSMACGRDTCSGCCSGTTCLAGTANSACNTGGNACVDCGPTGLCNAGVCTLDPASRWDVVVVDVTVPTTDVEGVAWDAFGGAPDPFVEVRAGSESAPSVRTSHFMDIFSATFNEVTAANVRADTVKTLLRFDVWDLDTSLHDWIGACQYANLPDEAFDGAAETLTCPANAATGNSGFTLHFRIQRH